jgi:hypothetical protein
MSRDQRTDSREDEGRAKRVPLGLQRNNKLDAVTPDGYVGRWMNDENVRIANAMKGGWCLMQGTKPVGGGAEDRNTDLGSCTSQIVGTNEDGTPQRAYWMVIKKEWYEEDQREKLKPVDEIERAIKGGKVGHQSMSKEDQENAYIPEKGRGIKIS